MFKRILIIVCSICLLTLSAKSQVVENESEDGPGLVGGDPDAAPTEVPFDDYVPFMIAGVVVYGVLANRQKKDVQVANATR